VNATGDVSFTGSVEQNGLTALAADSVESEVAIAVTGAASFGGAAAFGNTVSFGDEVSFGGDVTVTEEGVLTLTSGGAVTLAARKSIKVGNDAVLTAGSAGAVLTPGGAATLTPDLANKKLTLDAANLALTSGTLTVPAGATLELGDVLTVEAGAELAAAGDVTVAESDGGLTLTGAESTGGAKLSGAGKVTLGFGHITGGASGAWQAVGEETSIAFAVTSDIAASITGTGTGPVLAGLANDSAVITLAKGHTNGNAIALTVTNATIDISTKGAVAFPYVATTPATLVLQGGTDTEGKLKLGEGDTTNSNAHLTNGGHSVTISGTSHVIKGATSDAGAVAGIISGGETATSNDAVITGKTGDYDVTIKAGATLASS
jgi:filamentous hemagglutinin